MVRTKDVRGTARGLEASCGATVAIDGHTKSPVVGTTDEWKKMSYKFGTENESEVDAGPYLGVYGDPAVGTVWFADISLVEGGPVKK